MAADAIRICILAGRSDLPRDNASLFQEIML